MDTNIVPTLPTLDLFAKPQRNEKGQFVTGNSTQFQPGNTAGAGNHNAGRPSKYNEELQQKAEAYYQKCIDKKQVPFIQELQLELGITRETVNEWKTAKYENGNLKFPAFSDIAFKIDTLQELALLKRGIGGKAATFNMFLLKTKHGYIETDKQILAGDSDNKLEIVIVPENRNYDPGFLKEHPGYSDNED